MNCAECGERLADDARFCSACGRRVGVDREQDPREAPAARARPALVKLLHEYGRETGCRLPQLQIADRRSALGAARRRMAAGGRSPLPQRRRGLGRSACRFSRVPSRGRGRASDHPRARRSGKTNRFGRADRQGSGSEKCDYARQRRRAAAEAARCREEPVPGRRQPVSQLRRRSASANKDLARPRANHIRE